jgi:hypothetical protein
MQERPDKGAGGRSAARSAAAVVLLFAAAAGISRLCESLALTQWCAIVCMASVLLLVLALPVVLLRMLLRAGGSALARCRLAGVALGFAFVSVTRLSWMLGFDEPDELRRLVRRFDPLVQAIERFEREHGRAPQALADLVPGCLDRLPEATVLGERVRPMLRVEDGWALRVDFSFGGGWKSHNGELDYRPDQHYDDAPRPPDFRPRLEDGRYRGWHWRIVRW